jgi:hypothetical protein
MERDFYVQRTGISLEVTVQYWLLAITSAVLARVPWVPWRFGLRTVLIAMTLVAVALGIAVAFH